MFFKPFWAHGKQAGIPVLIALPPAFSSSHCACASFRALQV